MDRSSQNLILYTLIKIVAFLLLSISYPLVACERAGDESSKEEEDTVKAPLPGYKLVWEDHFDVRRIPWPT